MEPERIYRPLQPYTHEETENAIETDDIDILIYVACSTAMLSSNWKYAQDLCVRLSDHPDKTVRGNALLGLEYVARFQGKLEKHIVKPILLRALKDPENEVVERARDAIHRINIRTGWRIGERTVISSEQPANS